MFNIQPQVPGTKVSPLHQATGDKVEGPKPDDCMEGSDEEGRNTSLALSLAAAAVAPDDGNKQPDTVTDAAAKKQASMDVSNHEDRCFACRDGGGEFFEFESFRLFHAFIYVEI